jgi:hypothetical protein
MHELSMKNQKPQQTPLRSEAEPYHYGDQAFAIDLYAARMMVSRVTAEDAIRERLTDLGFKVLLPIYISREN